MRIRLAFILALSSVFATAAAVADPPSWAGKGKGKGHDRNEERFKREGNSPERHFADEHRVFVREYYEEQYRRGKCPPGLAKKHNGCMPPGQAKKWHLARPLPRGIVYYEVPPPLIVKLGPPPAGHRFVRVGADILLIAVGTGIVVDAIQDLGRM